MMKKKEEEDEEEEGEEEEEEEGEENQKCVVSPIQLSHKIRTILLESFLLRLPLIAKKK